MKVARAQFSGIVYRIIQISVRRFSPGAWQTLRKFHFDSFVIAAQTCVTFQTQDLRKAIPMVGAPRQRWRSQWKHEMFADRIKSPQCPKCGATMLLRIIEPERPGFDSRTFECPKCYDTEIVVALISREIDISVGLA
jgi:predicted RNA-binding Zn-ribbon protein involved in translation (DUF1610 family)